METFQLTWLDHQLIRTYMVSLQPIILLVSRYIISQIVWPQKHQLLQQKHSSKPPPLEKLKPEGNFFSEDYVTGVTFLLHCSEIFGKTRFFVYFHTFLNRTDLDRTSDFGRWSTCLSYRTQNVQAFIIILIMFLYRYYLLQLFLICIKSSLHFWFRS